jgi:TolA-binding protein
MGSPKWVTDGREVLMRSKIWPTIWAVTILSGTMICSPLAAQSTGPLDQRVVKLEKEMKAVQRSVFPGGTPVQPDIVGNTGPAEPTGNAASTPIADLTARIDTLEKGLAALTGQVEQTGYRGRQADEAIKRLEARLVTLEGGAAPAPSGDSAAPADSTPQVAPTSVPRPATAAPKPPTAKADPAHKAALAAVEMPSTGDAAEDDYTYGYRLYLAKLYPEAETKLKEFVTKYPTHKRYSYAQNLLGRAYLDEGKPALASVAFYDNYQKAPKGERAAESLTWLGQSLTKLKKPADACKVYDELQDVYGARLAPDLKARAAKGRVDAKCSA